MQGSSVVAEARAQVQANEAPSRRRTDGKIRMSLSQLEASRWHSRYDFEWEQPTAVQLLRELSDTLSSSFPPIGKKSGVGADSPIAAKRRAGQRASFSPMATRESPPSSMIVSTNDGLQFTFTKPVHGMEMWSPVRREKKPAKGDAENGKGDAENGEPPVEAPPPEQIPKEPLKKAPRKNPKKPRDLSDKEDARQLKPDPAVYLPRILSKLEQAEQDVIEAEAKHHLLCRRFAPSRRARRGRAVVASLESPFPDI